MVFIEVKKIIYLLQFRGDGAQVNAGFIIIRKELSDDIIIWHLLQLGFIEAMKQILINNCNKFLSHTTHVILLYFVSGGDFYCQAERALLLSNFKGYYFNCLFNKF